MLHKRNLCRCYGIELITHAFWMVAEKTLNSPESWDLLGLQKSIGTPYLEVFAKVFQSWHLKLAPNDSLVIATNSDPSNSSRRSGNHQEQIQANINDHKNTNWVVKKSTPSETNLQFYFLREEGSKVMTQKQHTIATLSDHHNTFLGSPRGGKFFIRFSDRINLNDFQFFCHWEFVTRQQK